MTTIETTIRPWGCNNQSILIGKLVEGKFVKDQMIRFADKDGRLAVKKQVQGKWAKNSTAVDYSIIVPANYPMVIASVGRYHAEAEQVEVLFSPVPAKKDLVLEFGKYAGKKLSEVPTPYLKWLAIHKNVLSSKNQVVVEDVKAFLA